MENQQKLTKAQKRELRKTEWVQEAEKAKKSEQYKKIGLWAGVAVIIFLGIFGLAWIVNSPSSSSTSTITVPKPSKADLFTAGNPKSKVVVTEYGDFQCPACKAYAPLIKQLIADEGKKVYFVYRYFPLTQVHQNAHIGAQAGWASNKQGKFWEMSDTLFQNQDDWATLANPQDTYVGYAKTLGMNTDKFKTDMNSAQASKFVDDSLNAALGLGLQSTPSFFINNQKIENPNTYDDFKKLVENELNKK